MLLLFLLLSITGIESKSTRTQPIRGWSSWDLSALTNHPQYGREFLTANTIYQQSLALYNSPLQQQTYPPYNLIHIDSFWAADPTQYVDDYGRWTYNTTRFPDGIVPVSNYIRNHSQLLGMYINPGVAVAAVKQNKPILNGINNCTAADIAVYPYTGGNQFWDCYKINYTHPCAPLYIQSQADLFASWNISFLKIDAVSPGSDINDPTKYDNRQDILLWSKALENTGKDIWLTISWAIDADYANDFLPYANAWRTSDDVDCYCDTLVSWMSVKRLFAQVRPWLTYVGYGKNLGLPDPDSLNVGNGVLDGLTSDEKYTYTTLVNIICAPLVTGIDLTNLSNEGILLLMSNTQLLEINAYGIPSLPINSSIPNINNTEIWVTNYNNGTYIISLFNLDDNNAQYITTKLSDFITNPWSTYTYTIYDLWTSESLGTIKGNGIYTTNKQINIHGVQLIRLDKH